MKVVNILKYGEITDQYFYKKFLLLLEELSLSEDKRKENYSLRSLDLENHMTFDLLVDNKKIVCFSGLYNRPAWGEGIFRSSNRTFVNPEYRTKVYNFLNPQFIVPSQVEFHKNEISLVFNSREHYKAELYFKKAKEKIEFYNDWIIHPGMVHVVPRSNKKSAYQKIMYKMFKGEIPFNFISTEEWKSLKE
jgi:hypothetical protein